MRPIDPDLLAAVTGGLNSASGFSASVRARPAEKEPAPPIPPRPTGPQWPTVAPPQPAPPQPDPTMQLMTQLLQK